MHLKTLVWSDLFETSFPAQSAGTASSCACLEPHKLRQILIMQQNTMWFRTFLHLLCWNKHKGRRSALLLPSFTELDVWHQDCLQSEILKCSFAGWVSEEFERVVQIGRVYLCQSSERNASSQLMCLCSLWLQHHKGRNFFFLVFLFVCFSFFFSASLR